jgi:hypothetical protein
MRFDPNEFCNALAATIRARKPFLVGLGKMTDWCSKHLPHADWAKIRALDVSEDAKKAVSWIPDVLRKHPCPFEVQALYFGLAEMANSKGEEFADLYVGFLGQYDPTDEESKWVFGERRHYPARASLKTKTLRTAGLVFNRESGEGLGNDGNYVFSLSYTSLLVASLMSPELYVRLGTPAKRVGILAGWDSGDLLRPGELTKAGLVPNRRAMI